MSQYLYLGTQNLSGKVYGPIDIKGGTWRVGQYGTSSLEMGAYLDAPEGAQVSFMVVFSNAADAAAFRAYIADKEEDANLALYIRDSSWYLRVWGVQVEMDPLNDASPVDYLQYAYQITCYLYGPYSYAASPTSWAVTWASSSNDLPQTKSLVNTDGHYAEPMESLAVTCYHNGSYFVEDLTLSIADGGSLLLTNKALTNEIWTLLKDGTLLETYDDPITSSTRWDLDTVGDGTYSSGAIILNNGQSAYYMLNGPHPARKPVKMTAALSLDSGSAAGLAYVEVSSDGVNWITALDQDDFESGTAVYYLNGTEYMTDIYVRFRCASGTSGKYLRLGSVKFEVERWAGGQTIPTVAKGAAKTATLSCDTGKSKKCDISGTFRARRRLV